VALGTPPEARPLVLVDAIEARAARLFPYLGNAVTLRWRAALVASEMTDEIWAKRRAIWRPKTRRSASDVAPLMPLEFVFTSPRAERPIPAAPL